MVLIEKIVEEALNAVNIQLNNELEGLNVKKEKKI